MPQQDSTETWPPESTEVSVSGDIEIGAVEIKDHDTDTRADVGADGSSPAVPPPQGLVVAGYDGVSFRIPRTDTSGRLIVVSTDRVGDTAAQVMTPALPAAGVEAVSGEIDLLGFSDCIVSVFADQNGELRLHQSYTSGGTFRQTGVLFRTVANEESAEIIIPARRFFRIAWKNTGGAAVTVLEVTVVRRR